MPRPVGKTVASHKGCAYPVSTCTYGNCKPAELCPGGRPVLRNRWAGDGGHHHVNQDIPEDELTRREASSGPPADAMVKDDLLRDG